MVWLMCLPSGLLAYRIIRGRFNCEVYLDLLLTMIVPMIKINFGNDIHFQQDNAPVRKAKVVRKFMKITEIKLIDWAVKSPDINIDEDIWKMLSDTIYEGRQFHDKEDFVDAIKESIYEINVNKRDFILKLYGTIRKRLCKILQNNGNLYNKLLRF